jgi:Protein of unknown function (DUF1588)/Protein of unknown function (DUF1592)/Protein of unknown function (DUF1595)/Protein of unknown function (DUF1585)/Protein of unknown function (DUF1587)
MACALAGTHLGVSALRCSIALVAFSLCAACDGQLIGAGGSADVPPGPGLTSGAGNGSGGTSTTPPGANPLDCSKTQVAAAPLRRLTREQYDNSIRDLLGIEGHPSLALSADEKLAAFFSNSISPVSRLSVEQYRDSAEDLAAAAVKAQLDTLAGCSGAEQNAACADRFIQSFGRRAFRRPLSAEEAARYRGLFDANLSRGFGEGIRVVLQTLLQSPNFVYHFELAPAPAGVGVAPLSGYEVASRLSFALWDTLPDTELLDAAGAGMLDTKEGLRAQAERLITSDRAKDALSSFHVQWLGLDALLDTNKDAQLFPQFTDALKGAMRDEATNFADFVIRRGDGRLATLLSAPFTVASPDLLSLYGATAAPAADGTVQLDPSQRAGLLTQGAFLAAHSHPNQTSPVHRGLAVRKNLLCTDLPDPPANVNNNPPAPDPNATTRQRFEQHRTDPTCAGCHQLLDPIGVGFENYDAIGRYRSDENGLPIDATGELVSAGTSSGTFSGAVELAKKLATSPEVRTCVQKQWFRFSLGRFEGPEDACTLQSLAADFEASDFDVKTLLLSLVTSDAFRYRKVQP